MKNSVANEVNPARDYERLQAVEVSYRIKAEERGINIEFTANAVNFFIGNKTGKKLRLNFKPHSL